MHSSYNRVRAISKLKQGSWSAPLGQLNGQRRSACGTASSISARASMNLIKTTKNSRHPTFRRARSLIVQAMVAIQKQVKTTGIWLFSAKENFLNSQRFSDYSPNTFTTKNNWFLVYFWFIQHYAW